MLLKQNLRRFTNDTLRIYRQKVLTVREQLQEDLITLLDSQFGEVDYLDDVKDLACQIVNDNFANLIK